jgi:hypothetical protein
MLNQQFNSELIQFNSELIALQYKEAFLAHFVSTVPMQVHSAMAMRREMERTH